jgi:glyoxylase-like metal-dependent hydrolase (beta-lactamase superfamily II)
MEPNALISEERTLLATRLPHITRISHGIVNSYLMSDSHSDNWMVVDTGLFTSASRIICAAEARFGSRKPSGIILTHGHFDHVGAALKLAKFWDVPIYAHPLEHPYLTGRSSYPPADPTVGGGFVASVMSRFFPEKPINLGNYLNALPSDHSIPEMPDWHWIPTPGHSPGHISLFREADSALIVGDAFVTTKQESFFSVLCQRQEVSRPPAYFTPDWTSAQNSVQRLASMQPSIAATGHGIPMHGEALRRGLQYLASHFDELKPNRGRYCFNAAETNESGLISVPPKAADPLPKIAFAAGLGLLASFILMIGRRHRLPHR